MAIESVVSGHYEAGRRCIARFEEMIYMYIVDKIIEAASYA